MQVVSVNVGAPRVVEWRGRFIETSIFKAPVAGARGVRRLGIEGDHQSDPRYHGGPMKAVYAYPAEHYDWWRETLALADLTFGAFGENLTLTGFLESDVRLGDRLTAGTAELVVTQPRTPCFKLGLRFGRRDMVALFAQRAWTGYYLAVAREGTVAAGDPVQRIATDPSQPTIAAIATQQAVR